MLVWTSLIAGQKRRAAISALGAVILALLAFQLARFYDWTGVWIAVFVAAALFVVRSVGAAAWFLGRHPYAQVDLGFSEAAVPGGFVRCAARIEARRPAAVRELRFRLTAESRGGNAPERELARVEGALDVPELPPGRRWEGRIDLPVPEGARYSYRSFEGRVVWAVAARLETEDWSPVETAIEVLVAPPAD